ncbi:TBC1 domain-containing protein [Fasciolopsis buskii]|uniref:TBC1 domain-containing protein n=1 Tax=Fasciolopsis buskii TaxID=27845 RepID=A0A8E0VP93_9TREM|nr:TBC1 domain-containing protein [Fasciolopsis buski]
MSWGSSSPSSNATLTEQWSHVVNNWDNYAKKRSYVSDLIRKGVPDEYRPLIWQLYTGAYDSAPRRLYYGYLEVESPVEKAIRRDIARTFPKHDLFKEENGYGQETLFRVIKAYSVHDREVGYCQGSGFIVGLLLMQLPELDAFAVLVQLMNDYRLREMYKPSMVELGVCMYQLERLLAEHLPDLYSHFVTHSFAPSLYASAWFLTLFSTILPIPMATRVMDMYIVEGVYFIFRMALAILKFSAEKLLTADMESMVVYLQHEGPTQWEQHSSAIFESANAFKLNVKKLKKLEKEYLTMRSQEREDQIELRRLRTENGLLLQRVTRLEEECGLMADRLVQSQMIRAQEAETMLALRCELSVLRRTHAEAMATVASTTSEEVSSKPQSIQLSSVGQTDHVCSVRSSEDDDPDESHMDGSVTDSLETPPKQSEIVSQFVNGPSVDTAESLPDETHPAELVLDTPLMTNGHGEDSSDLTTDSFDSGLPCPSHSDLFTPSRRRTARSQSVTMTTSNVKSAPIGLDSLHRMQSDLTMARAREADARSELLDLKTRYHDMEELKNDQATRANEQIAVLKDELFSVKLRETEALERLEDLRKRLEEIDLLWQTHCSQCKGIMSDSKRTSFRLGSHDSAESNQKIRLSDRILEARYMDQMKTLQQRLNDISMQREVADRRADRLDQRVSELLDSRTTADARERELVLELKRSVQGCAEIEAKRKADSLMWRAREIELMAQLTESRQNQLQLEYKYESLMATQGFQTLQSPSNSSYSLKKRASSPPDQVPNRLRKSSFTLGSYLPHEQKSSPSIATNSGESPNTTITLVDSNPSTPRGTLGRTNATANNKNEVSSKIKGNVGGSGVTAVWKNLPPSIMTDSIGPLEDLCLIPDDPMITSIYLERLPNEER